MHIDHRLMSPALHSFEALIMKNILLFCKR